jgi:hypothetical protein
MGVLFMSVSVPLIVKFCLTVTVVGDAVAVRVMEGGDSKLEDSYENLALLMEMITIPDYRLLQAELDVFKSGITFDGSADYSLQVAQQSGIHALCLVTYDLSWELLYYRRQPSVYYNYDRYLEGDVRFSW